MAPLSRRHAGAAAPRGGLATPRPDDITRELRQHAGDAYAAARAAGASESEARRQARAALGDPQALTRAIAGAGRDLRVSLRGWRRTPGFVLAAVVTLGLAIGAGTWMFAIVNAQLLEPLPFPQPQRLTSVLEANRQSVQLGVAWPDYLDWQAGNHTFTALAALRGSDMILAHLGPAAFVTGLRVTANYFSLLGGQPALGRAFTAADEQPGAPDVVMVSAAFYQDRLGSDPRWLGRALDLDGRARTVIGVMPPSFRGLDGGAPPAFWTPLGTFLARNPSLAARGSHAGLLVVGRLRPGVSAAAGAADLAAISRHLAERYPKSNANVSAAVTPLLATLEGSFASALWLLLAAAGLVLLIACANVANLLLARASGRRQELVVRAALGASRGQLLRQRLIESCAVAAAGGLLGMLLASAGLRLVLPLGNAVLARTTPATLDARALAVAAGLALATGLICGLLSGWGGISRDPGRALREPARRGAGRPRLRAAMVAGEMALAMVLLAGAALLLRSMVRLEHQNLGFQPQGVGSFIVGLPASHYPSAVSQETFFRNATRRLEQLPAVAAAGGIFPLPLSGDAVARAYAVVGRPPAEPGREPQADVAGIRGDYFGAMGIRLLRGRTFTTRDDAAAPPVAIVDAVLAQRAFGGPDAATAALGGQLMLQGRQRTIVGVVAHVQDRSLASGPSSEVYLPQAQSAGAPAALFFVWRARPGAAAAAQQSAIGTIAALDANLPVTEVESMPERLAAALAPSRRLLAVMGIFALLALVLAAVGIYSVLAYVVAERTHELGLRMALGAPRAQVLALVLRQGMTMAAAGAALGLGLTLGAGKGLAALLYGVAPRDPWSLIGAAAVLTIVAAAACLAPAWRATRVDPLSALREE